MDKAWLMPAKFGYIIQVNLAGAMQDHDFWDWCYANLKGKVHLLHGTGGCTLLNDPKDPKNDERTNKFHTFQYDKSVRIVVVEDPEDAMMLKLAWA
jgi:hypothetical protein